MNFSFFLLLVLLSWQSNSCENCLKALHETFKKGFNLTDKCDDCVVLNLEISFRGENWTGFCIKDQYYLFSDWKCRKENELLNASNSFALVTFESCELVDENGTLDEECLKKFNSDFCYKSLVGDDTTFLNDQTTNSMPSFERRWTGSTVTTSTTTEETSTTISTTTMTTKTTPEGTTFTEETSTETTTKERTDPSITFTFIENTKPLENNFSSTTSSPRPIKKTCEENEFFFGDHCYFIKLFWKDYQDVKRDWKFYQQKLRKKNFKDMLNSTSSCQSQHPQALGLAVETREENEFIMNILKTLYFYMNCTIFTSGVIRNDLTSEWRGWNLKINQSVLNLKEGEENAFGLDDAFYCINACRSYWYLFHPDLTHLSNPRFFIICERPYNSKKIQLELHERCLELYRKSSCYNLEQHSNFCCEKDEKGEIWFACPKQTHRKVYPNNLECSWTCKSKGFFSQDRPTCRGSYYCNASYNNIRYIAPATRYAISDCPKHYSGHSVWYCSWNRTFLGTPDYSLCCEDTNLQCRDTDFFLNIWMGCPSKKISKRTACPPGTFLEEALVEWYCHKNGSFNGSAPDYSNCNVSEIRCSKKDRYGIEWVAATETTAKKNCPPSFTGTCFWKCKKTGNFDGPEPDCSRCKADWMEEVAGKIKNQSNHEEVLEIMENYTNTGDLRIGFGYVINLTADCVVLFKKQSSKTTDSAFDKFLKSFSKILKNVAGNENLWSSFSMSNREEYADKILRTSEDAAFANLEIKNMTNHKYNATFAKSEVDGFDFFVAYNPSVESRFPLENSSESDWHLQIKEINESDSTFAAMGLVMSYSLSSLMFPQGETTESLEINAPAVTFTVASRRNGETVVDPNVVVSVSFKHKNRTRFPETQIIRRRLHKGEQPSGVFKSTLCYYYRDSEWRTEGCSVTFTSKDRTDCTCNHLSTIGLLMSVHKYEPNHVLEFVSTVSSGITIVSLILALLVFYLFDTIKNDRVLIGKNLCFCLLIGHIMIITVLDKKFFNIPDNACAVYAVVLHYIFMAAFAWMFVEGCHLYRMLVLVFDSDMEYRWIYLFIGYGVPFVIVGVTELIGFIFEEQPYGQDELCWLKPPNYVWAFVGPVILSTSINFCILITAMKLAISSKRRTEKSNFATLKLWMKGWISLSTLLGITWLFGLAYIHYNETFVYTFVVFNGLQGFFIFLFRCVLCEQYKTIVFKKVKAWFSDSKSMDIKKSENVKSETKVYAISATKSGSCETGKWPDSATLVVRNGYQSTDPKGQTSHSQFNLCSAETKDSGYDPEIEKSEVQKGCKSSTSKSSYLKSKARDKTKENSSGVDVDINITLTPGISEAYLRNRMIARNFSARRSKATWLADSKNFQESSHDDIYYPN